MEGTEGAGAGSVHDAVSTSQVILLADSTGNHITQKSRKRVFLPINIGVGNPLHHIIGHSISHASLFQGRTPTRVTETGTQGDHQFHGSGNPKDNTGPTPVIIALRPIAGIA